MGKWHRQYEPDGLMRFAREPPLAFGTNSKVTLVSFAFG